MQAYTQPNSGIESFEVVNDFEMNIKFKGSNKVYTYDKFHVGEYAFDIMQTLAWNNYGLCSYINKVVRRKKKATQPKLPHVSSGM